MNLYTIILLLLMTFFTALGAFFLKKVSDLKFSFLTIIKSKYLYLAAISCSIDSILNLILLKYIPYNIILPLCSLTYFWSFLLSFIFLKEDINFKKIRALLVIVFGVVLLCS